MATVLVTGGTGVLGAYLVPRLVGRGHDVRVLSRRPSPRVPQGATAVQGDVRTGAGLNAAATGSDAVIHAATSLRRARSTEVDGADVSDVLVDLVEAGPGGRAPEVGGPQVLTIAQINDIRARVTGSRALLIPVPPLWFVRDFVDGRHLCPDRAVGRVTWEEWLSRRRPAPGDG